MVAGGTNTVVGDGGGIMDVIARSIDSRMFSIRRAVTDSDSEEDDDEFEDADEWDDDCLIIFVV